MSLRTWLANKLAGRQRERPVWHRFGSFAAAQQNRLFEDWVASYMSGRDENRWELTLLRRRSREQCRNNPIARRYLGLCDENILGAHGIGLQARNMMANGEPDEETNQQIESAWEEWTEAENCTADGKQCFREFQGAVLESVQRDGEALVQLLPGFRNEWGFAVRQIDIDLLDENYNQSAADDRNMVVQGIELDRWGREVAYWLWNEHPTALVTSTIRRRQRVPATNILHLGRPRRVGQVRYEPALTPVLIPMRMLDEYQTAELVAARTGAERMGFITGGIGPDPNDPLPASETLETSKGRLDRLGEGETFVPWDNGHPVQAFDMFQKAILRQIAAGLNVSYAALTGDMSQSNYSSTRIAMLAERTNWEIQQEYYAERLCEPVYREWIRNAVIWQQLRLPGPFANYMEAEWECRGFEYIDPQKDVDADLTEVAAGLTSLTDVCARKGRDFATILRKRKAEIELAEELEVPLTFGKSAPGAPAAPAATAAPEAEPEEPEEPEELPTPTTNGNGRKRGKRATR
jgi:lambda family phage portal protein